MNDQQNNLPATTEQGSGMQIINPASGSTVKTVIGENSLAISGILLEQIKKVAENKDNIPQAKETRELVRELINLGKAEIDMFRVGAQLMKDKR